MTSLQSLLASAADAIAPLAAASPDAVPVAAALAAGLFTFFCTALGAAAVFLIRPAGNEAERPAPPGRELAEALSLGFAAGIMTAAAVWSLLIPALEGAEALGDSPWLTASGGLIAGALFLKALDAALPHLHPGSSSPEGPKTKMSRAALLFFAITLHNAPEGGSLGLSAAASLFAPGEAADALPALANAFALALGIGIQNIPEGAAVALPLAGSGVSRGRAFLFGALSGLVEPAAAILCALGAAALLPAMPFCLAFAAGSMIYVVVEELIPAAHVSSRADAASLAFIAGFAVMMSLDASLG